MNKLLLLIVLLCPLLVFSNPLMAGPDFCFINKSINTALNSYSLEEYCHKLKTSTNEFCKSAKTADLLIAQKIEAVTKAKEAALSNLENCPIFFYPSINFGEYLIDAVITLDSAIWELNSKANNPIWYKKLRPNLFR